MKEPTVKQMLAAISSGRREDRPERRAERGERLGRARRERRRESRGERNHKTGQGLRMHVQVSDGEVTINGRRINLACQCHNQRRGSLWRWLLEDPCAAPLGGLTLGLLLGAVQLFVALHPAAPGVCAPPGDGARIILGERPCIEAGSQRRSPTRGRAASDD